MLLAIEKRFTPALYAWTMRFTVPALAACMRSEHQMSSRDK